MNALMTMAAGLSGAARLAFGKPDGAGLVGGDRLSAIRSFWAIPMALPSLVCRLLTAWAVDGVPANAGRVMGRELIVFIVGWLLFIEITHRIVPLMGRGERWPRFIALWNWCNVVEGALIVLGGLPALLGAPPILAQAAELITIGWALWLEWFATRLALGISVSGAISFVLLDQVIGIILAMVAITLGGK
ncbi:MAG: hypothetical protein JSS43_03835 [Proteobacteria bacterium]|nr:hypothetical protein [Pseudomonadota bacterium]